MKICKNGDFLHISGIFDWKRIFLKNVLSIANAHLYGKKSEKTNNQISRKCQKTGFSSIFLSFLAGNEFFPKIAGSLTFWTLPFCNSVQNFMKKYKVQLENFKKYHFSGENRLFRWFLENSGYKNQFNWQMNHA